MPKIRKSLNEKIADNFLEMYRDEGLFFRTNAFLAFPVKVISAEHYYMAGNQRKALEVYQLCRDEAVALDLYVHTTYQPSGFLVPKELTHQLIEAIAFFLYHKTKQVDKKMYVGMQDFKSNFNETIVKLEDFDKIDQIFDHNKSPNFTIFCLFVVKIWLLVLHEPIENKPKLGLLKKEIQRAKELKIKIQKEEPAFVNIANAYIAIFESWEKSLEAIQP